VTRRHRRDFLLDSGGVSELASSPGLLVAYLELLEQRFDGALLIPVPVLTEVRSGQRRSDTLLDRLIKAIGAKEDVYAPLTPQAAARAGVLRAQAARRSHRTISMTDAQIVATRQRRIVRMWALPRRTAPMSRPAGSRTVPGLPFRHYNGRPVCRNRSPNARI
jgi:predicted nucleic acid-binding protein